MSQFLDQTSLLVVTCIFEKLEPFVDRILAFHSDTESKWSTEPGPLDLARIYSVSPPQGNDQMRAVMWTPRTLPGWTAFYVNSQDGRSHLFRKLSQAGGAPESVSIRSTLPDAEGGVQEFEYRRADSKDYWPTRILQWLKEEDGYRLVRKGEPLPFERNREIKSNPIETRVDLLSFVRDFGFDLENEDFWKTDTNAIYLNETWLKQIIDILTELTQRGTT
jgi:hypothetical protein